MTARCTCGYQTFRSERVSTEENVSRWLQFSTEGAGFGSSSYGTGAGGSPDAWGLFTATLYRNISNLTCGSCRRVRSSRNAGSIAVFAAYVSNGQLYVIAQSSGGAFSVVFQGDQTYTMPLSEVFETPAIVLLDTPDTVADTPAGLSPNTLLAARLPEPDAAGTYSVSIISSAFSHTIDLPSIQLEPPTMHVNADSADLDGFPRSWLKDQPQDAIQASNGARNGIPLEYCSAVAEFDGRLGSFEDQGWTAVGAAASDFPVVEGGVVQASTVAESYWEKTVVGLTGITHVHARAKHRITAVGGSAVGDGLNVEGLAATSGLTHVGVRYVVRPTEVRETTLDAASDNPGFGILGAGWNESAGGDGDVLYVNEERGQSFAYGTDATVASDHQVVARVGDRTGSGVEGHVANMVVSGPGRFLRAGFKSFASVSNPRLRFYLTSTVRPTTDANIRLKVRYSNSPDTLDDMSVETTVAMGDAGTLQEAALDLSGLDVTKPFWFWVERVPGAQDTMQATAFLHHVTIRAT